MPILSELAIYPIKSCAQISLDQASISPFGLQLDRRWMLIDETGYMLTQRKQARLCLIHCSIDNGQLSVTAPDMPALSIPAPLLSPRSSPEPSGIRSATIWQDTCSALDCGDTAAEWFSRFLKISARLVYFPESEFRQVDLNYASQGERTAFSDGFPYLLIGQSSLDDLNSRLTDKIEMRRFRPNLVISGTEAFAEDNWKKIRIGELVFKLVKPCSRCSIPSINPETADKSAAPLRTLAKYRLRDNKIYFGQNVIAEGTGTLHTGMPVEVLE